MIISASRRTDIPAFYSDWFLKRIRAGHLLVKNPFNAKKIKRISLAPSDVDAIVFWTRNPNNMIPYLNELDSVGYRYYFQFTITGYPRLLEKSVPHPLKAIEVFSQLSDMIGPSRVIWRYDPILLSNLVNIEEHKRRFERIASSLEGKTKRVVISFTDIYGKTQRNLDLLGGLEYKDILSSASELTEIIKFMSSVARHHGMEIQTCAENCDLREFGVAPGKCIDDDLIKSVFGLDVNHEKDPGQREACGCVKSVDIGQYNTCLHGCAYCYATVNQKMALANWEKHDPESPFLIGTPLVDVDTEQNESSAQKNLF